LQDLSLQIRRLDVQMKACYLWTVECRHSHAMILAGGILFAGGDDEVAALDRETGQVIWTGPVEGRAFGLCVANDSLYASTDRGHIHCFRHVVASAPKVVRETIRNDPYPQDGLSARYERAAREILRRNPAPGGYCLVLDGGEGRLAFELARQSDLKIVAVESDATLADRARRSLDEAGLCGRVVVHHVPPGRLPYTSYFANLVVSDGLLCGRPYPQAREVLRVLRPYGGMVAFAAVTEEGIERRMSGWGQGLSAEWQVAAADGLTWGLFTRGSLDGAGQWTHLYGEPGNSACSGDTLLAGPLTTQWFGAPGPRDMIDRHHRNVPPLARDGRLFIPGDCVVFAVDAYNGAPLWRLDVPDSRRLGAFLDCGNMTVDDRALYVAVGEECRTYDVRTGRPGMIFHMPQLVEDEPHQWGYVAHAGSLLFGSGCKAGASYTQTSYEADLALWNQNMKLVTSDYLFAQDRGNGALLWTYRDGLVLNTTITLAAGRLYFLETHCPAARADQTGRMPVKVLFAEGDQNLVALEQSTGRVVYKKKLDVRHFGEPVYLNAGRGVLLLSGSRMIDDSVRYYYDAFDAESGRELWRADHDSELPTDGEHGEYNRHPTIVGDTVYAWPYAYVLGTGERLPGWKFDRRGHGCGGISASAHCLFWRGGNPWMYDLRPQGGPARLNSVSRPGCWLNMIPAGGVLLIPEASSGCTCGFPLQTSLAYIPESSLQ